MQHSGCGCVLAASSAARAGHGPRACRSKMVAATLAGLESGEPDDTIEVKRLIR